MKARCVRRTVSRPGLHAFEATYHPHAHLPEHEHPAPFFTYVLRGDFIESTAGVARHCARGSVIAHAAREAHVNSVGAHGALSLNVEIDSEDWRELTSDTTKRGGVAGRVITGEVEWLALAVWREFHRDDDASPLALDEAIAHVWTALAEVKTRTDRRSSRAAERIAECISEHPRQAPRLVDAARMADMHPMHLAKLFRRRFGCSMGEFVRRRRVAWACGELGNRDRTIASIAVDAGFADHAHFTRSFRRIVGCTPTWYRDQIRKCF